MELGPGEQETRRREPARDRWHEDLVDPELGGDAGRVHWLQRPDPRARRDSQLPVRCHALVSHAGGSAEVLAASAKSVRAERLSSVDESQKRRPADPRPLNDRDDAGALRTNHSRGDLLRQAVSGCRRTTRESQRIADQRGEVRRCRRVTTWSRL